MGNVIVYIDGPNLLAGLEDQGWSHYRWLDLWQFSSSLLRDGDSLKSVNLFISDVKHKPSYHSQLSAYLKALQAHRAGVVIKKGDHQPVPRKCRLCSQTYEAIEEKRTDVNIASAILTDFYLEAFDTAILVSGDADQCTPVEIVSNSGTKKIDVLFPPSRESQYLRAASNGSARWADEKHYRKNLLPASVKAANGKIYTKPPTW